MRLFFALCLDPDVQQALASLTSDLVRALPSVAWIPSGKMHVTLSFLGEVHEERVAAFATVARGAVRGVAAHEVTIGGVGAFPNLQRPRVVWLGMQHADHLAHIAAALDAGVGALGIERETRGYQPHVTLARIRPPLLAESLALLGRLAPTVSARVPAPVRAVTLMHSRLAPTGSRYDVIETFPLEGR